ncbi:ribokinase [Vibrio sp. 10N.261.51.F12]|uniref:ribokinase n=1 Tax=Vibrio sp. 10N.261.51.F12 TaxID=3229679 RepID=UPI003552A8B7
MYDIIVLGSINMDVIAECKSYPNSGDTAFCNAINMQSGGKGNNQAISAANYGKKVCFVGSVGNDSQGKSLRDNLKTRNISDEHIVIKPNSKTGTCVGLVEPTGENTLIVNPGANMELTSDDVAEVFNRIEGTILLIQMETSKESVLEAMKIAKQKGMLVILDPAPVDGICKESFVYADIIVPNSAETKFITGIEVYNESTALEAAKAIHALGVETVIIKMGGNGCLLFKNDKSTFIPALKVDAVDTVGAGDCFAGALASHLSDDVAIEDAIKFAQVVAGIKVTRFGGQDALPSMTEVEDKMIAI